MNEYIYCYNIYHPSLLGKTFTGANEIKHSTVMLQI